MAITARGTLQTRLQSVLNAIHYNSAEHLYTKSFEKEKCPSLITIFDNGIDPDPAYSGPIIGRIYLDAENHLCLATWPLDENRKRPWRNEILLPNVSHFEFEFLGERSASEHGKKEKITPINAAYAWRTAWAKSQRASIPSIIRLTIREEGRKEPLRFAFILPSPEPYVVYREKKA